MTDIRLIGGKGKGLVWLSQNIDLGYEVPLFDFVDASHHDEYLANGNRLI